ncbi:hypothetical protein [Burkholderia ubonensis]|uniref:hypothetical protein n=1 Tax=Burkholderia ubonensis TaxID=101571 RepID=UPI0012F9F10F|nr:hypothetical protein [Burkholderia ubonensis]
MSAAIVTRVQSIVDDFDDGVERLFQPTADLGSSISAPTSKYFERTPVGHKTLEDKKVVDVCQPKPFQ